ncbi:tripartite tricarboxylate transporter TctB family protein [Salicibibacter cibarius]|uniref:Tripartite tricarboxylate transporter TctB family protein n=1 Tax=Salicibibacter cibarius TaxID=2743000 RepID=A0A7T7CD77_9BACI|nr:tripartite tricarboxylate transporter TctB family protein [Salicibibacter cibarius]QQK77719.1 tripartite tricarboxylate transporter TctB family protein [Salicibibacter cibarius]
MKKAEIIFAFMLLLFSIFMLVEALGFEYSSDFGPGPGFAPVWLSIILILLATTLILSHTVKKEDHNEGQSFFKSKKGLKQASVFLLALIISITLVDVLGLILVLTLFSFFTFKFIEKYSWVSSVGVSLGSMVFVIVVFNVWLDIPTPTGLFFF